MAQKLESQSPVLMGPFYNTWNIRYVNAGVILTLNKSQIGLQRSEWIRSYLHLDISQNRDQGRFPGIGKTYKAYIGYQFSSSSTLTCPPSVPFLR